MALIFTHRFIPPWKWCKYTLISYLIFSGILTIPIFVSYFNFGGWKDIVATMPLVAIIIIAFVYLSTETTSEITAAGANAEIIQSRDLQASSLLQDVQDANV